MFFVYWDNVKDKCWTYSRRPLFEA